MPANFGFITPPILIRKFYHPTNSLSVDFHSIYNNFQHIFSKINIIHCWTTFKTSIQFVTSLNTGPEVKRFIERSALTHILIHINSNLVKSF
jgi:hypothetical protein